MARKIQVEIIGDSRSIERAFKRAGKAGSGFGRTMSTIGKIAGVGLAGGFVAMGYAAKRGFDELAEGQKVAAQTNAVLRSTGSAANVTAKRVDRMASSLSRMSGIDDEAIASAENLLLTFTNIQNRAGKGNAIFDRTTQAVLDMSTAMGMDLNSAAIMVGKALNQMDVTAQGNVRGFMALRRVGVQISPEMMRVAAAFINAGKPMEAQKLLLKELQTEFGGSARAFGTTMPGALGKLRNAFDEVAAAFAQGFLPLINRVAKSLTQKLADPAFVARVREIGFLVGTKLFNAFLSISGWFNKHWGSFETGFRTLATLVRITARLLNGLKNAFIAVWNTIMDAVTKGLELFTHLPKRLGGGKAQSWQKAAEGAKIKGGSGSSSSKNKKVWEGTPTHPRALGGPVFAGMSYRVGERGPETFVPSMNGHIVPNGAGGGVYINNLSLPGVTNPRQFLAELQRIGKRGTAQQRGRWAGQNLALS